MSLSDFMPYFENFFIKFSSIKVLFNSGDLKKILVLVNFFKTFDHNFITSSLIFLNVTKQPKII